jgi:hypothetical protein
MNPIAIGNGGTSATTAPQALANLGAIGVASPAFTGTPTAPTPPLSDNSTRLATTAFVKGQGYLTGTTGVASFNTRTGAVALSSADVTSALTYTPYNATNPAGYQTAAQVTAVLPVAATTNPLMDGTAAVGTGTTWARADHVHASDTSRLPLIGGTLSGALAINPATAVEPLTMQVPSGGNARLWQTVTGTRQWSTGVMTSSGKYQIDDQTTPATRFVIDTNGNTYNTTGSWVTLSDARLKTDIVPYERGLAAVRQLNPVAFRFNGRSPMAGAGENALRYGLIADDVQLVMPEICGSTDIVLTGEEILTTVATLEPGQMIYALINAVKELATKVDALEATAH